MVGFTYTKNNNNSSPVVDADGIEFCDIQKRPSIRKFAKKFPAWRVLNDGFAYDGKCINLECVAYGRTVCINRGYGRFDIARDVHRHAKCPMCDHACTDVTNCSFSWARWSFCGLPKKRHGDKVANSKSPPVEVVTRGISNDPDTFCEFDAAVSGLATWAYLSVTVTPPSSSLLSSKLSDEDDWVEVVDQDTGECPACMENMLYTPVMKLSCGHCICPICFKRVNKCPLCRAHLRKAECP